MRSISTAHMMAVRKNQRMRQQGRRQYTHRLHLAEGKRPACGTVHRLDIVLTNAPDIVPPTCKRCLRYL